MADIVLGPSGGWLGRRRIFSAMRKRDVEAGGVETFESFEAKTEKRSSGISIGRFIGICFLATTLSFAFIFKLVSYFQQENDDLRKQIKEMRRVIASKKFEYDQLTKLVDIREKNMKAAAARERGAPGHNGDRSAGPNAGEVPTFLLIM